MALSPEDVARLAALARIELTDEEQVALAPQLDVILESVASEAALAGDDIAPQSHALPLTNVFRPDEVRPGLAAEADYNQKVLVRTVTATRVTMRPCSTTSSRVCRVSCRIASSISARSVRSCANVTT